MTAEKLLQLVRAYNDNRDFITNEETAKMALVVPFLRLLGYDPNLPREVRLEYAAEFTQGDGKRLPDRMDFAIFDRAGVKPLIVIETKPLGTDLRSRTQQLARYISQLPDLHFGILTDGCTYLFFGDLESPNVMDREPFFTFNLSDPKTDWGRVAEFLEKFSREAFNADTLITDAENSRYRQSMTLKMEKALRDPSADEGFMRWLTSDIYGGKRTGQVMQRMGQIAKEAVEPAILRVLGDDFVDKLKDRIRAAHETENEKRKEEIEEHGGGQEEQKVKPGIVTTEEELKFYDTVREICVREGYRMDQILFRDTVNYCNVSFERPTKWFVRFFGESRRKNITTWVPLDEAKQLNPGVDVEESPPVFGASRIYLENMDQLNLLAPTIIRSLRIVTAPAKSGQSADDDEDK